MTTYAVFTGAEGPAPGDGEIEIVADGFSWFAFLATGIWCLWHRLWVEFALLLVAVSGLVGVAVLLNPNTALGLAVLMAMLIGFEAPSIREAALTRRGYARRTDFAAASRSEAELRWLARAVSGRK